jgi:hypothetical protein
VVRELDSRGTRSACRCIDGMMRVSIERMRQHRTWLVSLALLAAACGAPGKDDHIADEVPDEPAAAATVADTTEVEDPEYQKRVASMSSYEDCIKQAVGLEAPHAKIIKEACERRKKTAK